MKPWPDNFISLRLNFYRWNGNIHLNKLIDQDCGVTSNMLDSHQVLDKRHTFLLLFWTLVWDRKTTIASGDYNLFGEAEHQHVLG